MFKILLSFFLLMSLSQMNLASEISDAPSDLDDFSGLDEFASPTPKEYQSIHHVYIETKKSLKNLKDLNNFFSSLGFKSKSAAVKNRLLKLDAYLDSYYRRGNKSGFVDIQDSIRKTERFINNEMRSKYSKIPKTKKSTALMKTNILNKVK